MYLIIIISGFVLRFNRAKMPDKQDISFYHFYTIILDLLQCVIKNIAALL